MVIVEPLRNAFGRYKTKEFINTVQGRIPRDKIVSMEVIEDDPWQYKFES